MRHSTFVTLAAGATGAFASPIATSSAPYACNPAHQYPEGVQCVSTNGALSLVTPSATAAASSTGFACNPAHSYPNGASCVSTNGALSLVTPTAAPSSTAYACNPAHSYPNGASCVSTNGALSLVTPTAAASSTAYACNPAHEACATVSGQLVPASTAAASSTVYACNPAHEACATVSGQLVPASTAAPSSTVYACNPAHEACATVSGQLVPANTAAASSAASSAAKAASTGAATSGETKAEDLTWTVENLSRYCAEDKSGCDYNFNLTASDNRPSQACTIIRLDVKDAPTESWSDIACTADSPIKVSWGYSAQFGAENAFAVMTVVNDEEKAKAYFGVANVNSQKVTPSNPYGSGLYGNIGPQPVYLF